MCMWCRGGAAPHEEQGGAMSKRRRRRRRRRRTEKVQVKEQLLMRSNDHVVQRGAMSKAKTLKSILLIFRGLFGCRDVAAPHVHFSQHLLFMSCWK